MVVKALVLLLAVAIGVLFVYGPALLSPTAPLIDDKNFVAKPKGWDEFHASSPFEQRDALALKIKVEDGKKFPSWLRGRVLRNTAALHKIAPGSKEMAHEFDGFAKIVSVTFDGSESAKFQARFAETKVFNESKRLGDIAPTVLFGGVEPPFSIPERIYAVLYDQGTNPNVNVMSLGEKEPFILTTDVAESWLIDHGLNTIGKSEFNDEWSEREKATGIPHLGPAHPVQLGSDFFTVVVDPNPKSAFIKGEMSTLAFVEFDSKLKRKTLAKTELPFSPYFHAVAATESAVIAHLSPMEFDLLKLITTMRVIDGGLFWNYNRDTSIVVADKKTGTTRQFIVDPGFSFHIANAFDTATDIVIDYVFYINDTAKDIYKHFNRAELARGKPKLISESVLRRYKISKTNSTVSHYDFPNGNGLEFPRINENYQGKDYCIVYALVLFRGSSAIAKVNVCTGERKQWTPNTESAFIAEPLFASNPNGKLEDDGVLLTTFFDGVSKKTYQAVIDTTTMTLIATVELPFPLSYPLHGGFFASKS